MRIAPEGLPFVLPMALAALAGWLLVHPWLGLALLLPTQFAAWFFRDPDRATPRDPDLVISPADGRILLTRPGRISVFMNVFNVHVCRAPTGGVVEEIRHTRGDFRAAFREEASEQNERVSIRVRQGAREIRFTLVAGLVARRIVCRIREGDHLLPGDRIGLIRFGSRVDVDLPEGAQTTVKPGQRVVAGETALARLRASARPEAASVGAGAASTR